MQANTLKLIFYLSAFLLLPFLSSAQAFQSHLGSSGNDRCTDLVQLESGDYLLGGYSFGFGASSQIVFAKVNASDGSLEWFRSLGGGEVNFAHGFRELQPGVYAMAGWNNGIGPPEDNISVMVLGDGGTVITANTVGGVAIDRGRDIIGTADNGFIVTGHTNSEGAGLNDVVMLKYNEFGGLTWARTYGGSSNDNGWALASSSASQVLAVGNSSSNPIGFLDALTVAVNPNTGDTLWTRHFGIPSASSRFNAVSDLADGNYIAVGDIIGFDEPFVQDILVAKFSSSGDIIWAKVFDGEDFDAATGVVEAPGGEIWVSGWQSLSSGDSRNVILRLSSTGSLELSKSVGPGTEELAQGISLNNFGGVCVAGDIVPGSIGDSDFQLLSMSGAGIVGCDENDLNMVEDDANLSAGSGYTVANSAMGILTESFAAADESSAGLLEICSTTVTSIEEPAAINFKIYPNPAQEFLQIDWPNTSAMEMLRIFDRQGNLIHQQNLESEGSLYLDIKDFIPGVYEVEIHHALGISTKFIVKVN